MIFFIFLKYTVQKLEGGGGHNFSDFRGDYLQLYSKIAEKPLYLF
jgi:hypothetical protein